MHIHFENIYEQILTIQPIYTAEGQDQIQILLADGTIVGHPVTMETVIEYLCKSFGINRITQKRNLEKLSILENGTDGFIRYCPLICQQDFCLIQAPGRTPRQRGQSGFQLLNYNNIHCTTSLTRNSCNIFFNHNSKPLEVATTARIMGKRYQLARQAIELLYDQPLK